MKAETKKKEKKLVDEDSSLPVFSDLDFLYVHYRAVNKGYELYVIPHLVKIFYDQTGIECEYNEELKVFTATVRQLPRDGNISFVEFKNRPVSPAIQGEASDLRDELEEIDNEIEALEQKHAQLKKRAMRLILENGISTRPGCIAHRKLLTNGWVSAIRQLLPEIERKTPTTADIEELIENHPKHKKALSKLLGQARCFEIQDLSADDLLSIFKKLRKYDVKDLKIAFTSSDEVDEDEFQNCFSWESRDVDFEQTERVIESLPFEVKLDLYDLPTLEDINIQFHYKTDQKTEPGCVYCGDDLIRNTNKCSTCGLTSFKVVKKEVEKPTPRKAVAKAKPSKRKTR